jgi:hypothetical protein
MGCEQCGWEKKGSNATGNGVEALWLGADRGNVARNGLEAVWLGMRREKCG